MSSLRPAVIAASFAFACQPCLAAVFNVTDVSGFQNALTTAATNGENDTINVAAGTYNVTTTLSYSSSEGRQLTIIGAGIGTTILDGGDSSQILSLDAQENGADLTVQAMTLRNGRASGSGGGALLIGTGAGNQTISSCEVSDSTVTGSGDVGGGVAAVASSGDVTVINSRFLRNSSSGNVGGLIMSTASGRMELTNSFFEDNTVSYIGGADPFGDAGGAQLYSDGGATAEVRDCVFIGNEAAGGANPDGGGLMIYLLGADGTADVRDSVFRGNSAGLGGAGLWIRLSSSGTVNCQSNFFTGNTTTINGGSGAGLYIELNSGDLTVTGNTASGNQAAGAGGGAWISHFLGTGSLTDNIFVNNHAAENGGGLLLFTENATTTIDGLQFWSNTCGNIGAGLSYATTSGSLILERSTFASNNANNGTGEGGGIYLYLDEPSAPTAFFNLILWQNIPDQLAFSSGTGTAPISVTYSISSASSGSSWYGTGCSVEDPLFVTPSGGDLHLASASSPAVNSGDPASATDPDGSRADMGALPWDPTYLLEDGFEIGNLSAWSAASP